MNKYTLLALLCTFTIAASAQSFNCGSMSQQEIELQKQNPNFQVDNALLESLKNQIVSSSRSEQKIIIPIVFHIVHNYGPENISDEQVYDQVRILNRDYQKLNADTSAIVPSFVGIAAKINIEFRLAHKDPAGNCTNGIDRIYSVQTNIGGDFAKKNQWDRSSYLNVWVVKKMADGVAGYAYKPQSVSGSPMYKVDGIMILNDYIGSIGTSTPNNSRALTHEIGHYLGLDHPWGATNQPGVACGDDGIMDTPGTKGWTTCNLNGSVCTPPIIENVQNYMEYAYCSNMFTEGQKTYMRNVLNTTVSDRKMLWEEFNLEKTGTNDPYVLVNNCKPVADFSVSSQFECTGNQVLLKDASFNGIAENWDWVIQDGTPSTASTSTVNVTFSSPGWKQITLTVANQFGSSTITKTSFLYIGPSGNGIANYYEDFEGVDPLNNWQIVNPEENASKWTLSPIAGYFFSHCLYLNSYGTTPGDADYFVTPSMNLNNGNSNAFLRFKGSCATKAVSTVQPFDPTSSNMTEVLNVYSSTNCGKNWQLRKSYTKAEFINAGSYQDEFFPNSINDWKEYSIVLPSNAKGPNVKFKFEYVAGNKSNNIYIDDINVSNFAVGIDQIEAPIDGFSVYPNPASHTVYIEGGTYMPSDYALCDVTGRVISTATIMNSLVQIDISTLADGIYIIRNMKNGQVQKLVVKN